MAFSPDANIAMQWQDLTLYLSKDADLTLTLTDPVTGLAYNLTGLTVNFIRKPNRDTPDSGGKSYTCTVTTSSSGIANVTLPAADNGTPGVSWYRVDLVGTETKTVKFGRLTVYAV